MDLSKKTTILLTEELHERLKRLAALQGTSIGELIRRACELQYGLVPADERLEAVKALAALRLPVGDIHDMEKDSVPPAEDLLP